MAEPHGLEDRAVRAICGGDWCKFPSCGGNLACGIIVKNTRAVLDLVRQEQEKDSYINVHGIKHWWLSHTAPQEK